MTNKLDYDDLYCFLIDRYGEIEAMKTIEALEAVVDFEGNIERIRQTPEQRIIAAMTRLHEIDFAA